MKFAAGIDPLRDEMSPLPPSAPFTALPSPA